MQIHTQRDHLFRRPRMQISEADELKIRLDPTRYQNDQTA
jgi:hypothetical protein